MNDETRPETPSAGEQRAARASTARNTTLSFAAQVGASVLALFNSVVLFRVMGASSRGELAFLTVVANLGTAVSLFGTDVAHGNILGQRPERAKVVASNAWLLALLLGGGIALLMVALFVIFPGIKPTAPWGLILAAVASIPFMVLALNLRSLAVTEYHFNLANLALIVVPVINLGGNIVFALFGDLSVGIGLFTWIAGQLISLALLAAWTAREIGYARPDLSLMGESLRFGAKNHLTSTMQLANFRIDQWFVGLLAGNAQLGIYVNAVAFAETLFYLPQAVATAMRPNLIRAEHRDAGHQAAVGARLAVIVTGIGAIALIVLAPLLMRVFFGPEGTEGTGMLQMLAPGAIGITLTKVLSTAMASQNRPLATALPIALGLAVTLTLDILLIPDQGGFGAAIASTAAYLVAGVAMAIAFARVFKLPLGYLVPRWSDARALAEPARDYVRSRRSSATS